MGKEEWIRCDMCGEIVNCEKRAPAHVVQIKAEYPWWQLYMKNEKEEYYLCHECFENMKEYCRTHKGEKK